jgi:hypothetical protein
MRGSTAYSISPGTVASQSYLFSPGALTQGSAGTAEIGRTRMRAGRVHLIVEAESSPDLKWPHPCIFLSSRISFASGASYYPIDKHRSCRHRPGRDAHRGSSIFKPCRRQTWSMWTLSPLVPGAILTCLQHRCRATYWSTSSKNMDCSRLKNTLAPDRLDSSDA